MSDSRFAPELASEVAYAAALQGFDERAQAAVLEAELELDSSRARLMSRYGAPIWACFALYDVLQSTRPEVGHLPELLLLRAVGTLLLAGFAVLAQRSRRSTRWRIDVSTTLAGMLLSLCLALMSLFDGGFASMYGPGLVLVMCVINAVPRPFRRALRVNLLVISPYPLVLGLAALLSSQHAALLRERGAVTAAVQFHFTLLATLGFVSLLGHTVWSLRRQLLATQALARLAPSEREAAAQRQALASLSTGPYRSDPMPESDATRIEDPTEVAARTIRAAQDRMFSP
ncbi:MAG TPA: hypothetical protein VMF89_28030 [Polyangiales bacterium]|nr:hypothetical protein [Polyangiales bacterium]